MQFCKKHDESKKNSEDDGRFLFFLIRKSPQPKRRRTTTLLDKKNLYGHNLLLGDALVDLTHLESNKGLEETGTVVGSRERAVLEHLLCDLTVELGRGVAEVALQVDELLHLVELTVHLEDGDLLTVVVVGAVVNLHAGVAAGELAAAGDPRDGGTLIEEESGVEQLLALLLDETHAQDLALLLVGDELGGEHLDDHVSLLLLGINVGVEIGLTGLDGGLDGLQGVATLSHITLDLPGELGLVGDVQVDAEIDELVDAVIEEGVETLNDEDLGGINLLRGIEETGDMVVDGLLDSLALLESLDLQSVIEGG